MTKSRYKGRLRIQSKFGAGQKHCCIGLLHCPAPQGWLGFFRAKRREKNSISYCVFDLVLMYFALFDTIHSPCSIRFGPLRFLIFRLRLKQFSELFYSQNSRVLETLLFQALFSRRKVSNISSKIEFSLQLQYHSVYTKAVKQFVQNNKDAYVCKHTHLFLVYFPCSNRSTVW